MNVFRPRLVFAIVLFGLFVRGLHYFRTPSIWHDEAALIVNAVELDFHEQFGPLLHHEASPPLFLWITRAVYLLFGDGLLALRLPAFLASCAALMLMPSLARRLLPETAVPWAVLLFAASEKLAWHACEAKPYAVDVLVAVVLLRLCCSIDSSSLLRRIVLLVGLAPVFLWLSYPACFVLGGVLTALLPPVLRDRRNAVRCAYGTLVLSIGIAFVALALGPARAQRDGAMMSCWTRLFPDWSNPSSVLLWVPAAIGEVFRYNFAPVGQLLVPLGAIGVVVLWKARRWTDAALLAVPAALVLFAAMIHRYPCGGARVIVFLSPGLAILIALGVPVAWSWLRERSRASAVLLVVLLLAPIGTSLQRFVVPWARPDVAGASAWVLAHREHDDEVVGNDWTHQYCFRSIRARYRELPSLPPTEARRVWIVVSSQASERERLALAQSLLAPDRRIVMTREFALTTVLLTERN